MNIIFAILLFGFIVFIHELGHFLFAKRAGIKVSEFAIGMGPNVYGFTKGETTYSIRLLPIGGYISMEGEDENSNDPRSFGNKTILQRFSVLFAGPFFNIILAAALLIPVFLFTGVPTGTNVVGSVVESSPAQSAGIQVDDKIVSINGNEINTWEDIINNFSKVEQGATVDITINRDGKDIELDIVPQLNDENRLVIGVSQQQEKGIVKAITSSVTVTYELTREMLKFVGQLITGTLPGGVSESVSGPVGVLTIVSDAAKDGIIQLLYIGSVISLNLGILNLLPIPALDGGRILFLLIEALRGGKKIDPEKEGTLHFLGFVLLMGFTLFVTYKDIVKLF